MANDLTTTSKRLAGRYGCLLPFILFLAFFLRGELDDLPFADGIPLGNEPISGVATMSDRYPGIVFFEPDRIIRSNLEGRGSHFTESIDCLFLSETQWEELRKSGARAHVRGEARSLFMPAWCPLKNPMGRSTTSATAYRALRLEPMQRMPCSAEAFVMSNGRCTGFDDSGQPRPPAAMNPKLVDIGKYYPPELRKHGIPAAVTIRYSIGPKGLGECRAIKSSGIPAVDRAACTAVRNEPAMWPQPRFAIERSFQAELRWDKAPDLPAAPATSGAFDLEKYYPDDLRRAGVTGRTRVTYTLGPDGPSDCRVTESSGNARLDAATCRLIAEEPNARPAPRLAVPRAISIAVKWQLQDDPATKG